MPAAGGVAARLGVGRREPEQPAEERGPEQQRHAGHRAGDEQQEPRPHPRIRRFDGAPPGEAGHRRAGADGQHLQHNRRPRRGPRGDPRPLRHERHARHRPDLARQILAEARHRPDARGGPAVEPLAPSRQHRPPRHDQERVHRPDHERAQHQPAGLDPPLQRLRSQLGPVAQQASGGEPDDGEADEPLRRPQPRPTHPGPRDTIPRTARPRARARAGRATIRPPAWRAPCGRGPAAGRASRRSAPRPTAA